MFFLFFENFCVILYEYIRDSFLEMSDDVERGFSIFCYVSFFRGKVREFILDFLVRVELVLE